MYPGHTSDSFVDTKGDFVLGFNGTGSDTGSVTLNGVTFQNVDGATMHAGYTQNGVTISTDVAIEATNNSFRDGGFDGDENIYNLIAGGLYGASKVTLSGLTVGRTYQIQIFTNDAREGRGGFETGFSDGVRTLADSLAANTAGRSRLNNVDEASGELSGDSILGTFVADAGIQSFEVDGSTNAFLQTNNGRAHLNAAQIRDLPEPLAYTLLAGFSALAFAMLRRRY